MTEIIVGSRYKIGSKIGCGSFGEIYSVTDTLTGLKLAAKAERIEASHPQLKFENQVYKLTPHAEGIPKVYWCGVSGKCNVMIMELLGQSLETLFSICGRKFSLKTVILIAIQLIQRLQHLHEYRFIHRDVKPDNFLIGLNKASNLLYIIDMGLCKQYLTDSGHIPFKCNKRLTGTPRYASI